jgi:hypothetical protein
MRIIRCLSGPGQTISQPLSWFDTEKAGIKTQDHVLEIGQGGDTRLHPFPLCRKVDTVERHPGVGRKSPCGFGDPWL